MSTNEKIVKQGFEMHGYRFVIRENGQWYLKFNGIITPVSLEKLTEVCKTITRVVGFGLPGND